MDKRDLWQLRFATTAEEEKLVVASVIEEAGARVGAGDGGAAGAMDERDLRPQYDRCGPSRKCTGRDRGIDEAKQLLENLSTIMATKRLQDAMKTAKEQWRSNTNSSIDRQGMTSGLSSLLNSF